MKASIEQVSESANRLDEERGPHSNFLLLLLSEDILRSIFPCLLAINVCLIL